MSKIKTKKTKRIIILCILTAILVISIKSIGYLPVLGNIIAEKKLSDYASITRGSVQKINTMYNLVNMHYVSHEENLIYDLKYNTIHDYNVSEQLNLAAREQYSKIIGKFSENLSFPSIFVSTGFNANDYSKKFQRLYILGIYNTEDISEEDSKKMPAAIADKLITLMGENYNFTGIQIIYFDRNGGYESAISSHVFKKLGYDEILSKTEKSDRLSEDYLKWLSKQ